ncbi:MAG: hypothetical protein MUO77_05125 [Anaerolineales bacterium]|nr:hypothetical protein [Anaerolineales bacterium]
MNETNKITKTNKTGLIITLIAVVAVSLFFTGWAMIGTTMSIGMMGSTSRAGTSWMWIPALFTLGVGILFGWAIFRKKTN